MFVNECVKLIDEIYPDLRDFLISMEMKCYNAYITLINCIPNIIDLPFNDK